MDQSDFVILLRGLITGSGQGREIFLSSPKKYFGLLSANMMTGVAYNVWTDLPERSIFAAEVRKRSLGSMVFVESFKRISGKFSENDISHCPYKGVDLILSGLYPDESWRSMNDIDIIVAEQDYGRALDVLRQEGFRELPALNPGHTQKMLRGGPLEIDLHWSVVSPDRYRLPPAFIFEDGPWSPEKRLYFLLLHGGMCRFRAAIWLYDVMLMMSRFDIDWHVIEHYCQRHRTRKIIAWGRHLALATLGQLKPDLATRAIWNSWEHTGKGIMDRLIRYNLFDSEIDLLRFAWRQHKIRRVPAHDWLGKECGP